MSRAKPKPKASEPVEADAALLVNLVQMGFAEDVVRVGLQKFRNDEQRTLDWLLEGPTLEDEPKPAASAPAQEKKDDADDVAEAKPAPSAAPAAPVAEKPAPPTAPSNPIELPKGAHSCFPESASHSP